MVRGLVGIEVDSLDRAVGLEHFEGLVKVFCNYLHKVTLEEIAEIPLSSRVREIPNVETTSLSDDGDDSIILSCVGLTTILDGSGSQGVGDILDGRHDY